MYTNIIVSYVQQNISIYMYKNMYVFEIIHYISSREEKEKRIFFFGSLV